MAWDRGVDFLLVSLIIGLFMVSPRVPLSVAVCSGSSACNALVNPGFEDLSTAVWLPTSSHNGTVSVSDKSNPHMGSHAAMMNATRTASTCGTSSECKDWVGASVREDLSSIDGVPSLDSLSPASDSFSAWLYVANPAQTGMRVYSVHVGIGFRDSSGKIYSIEYWYGTSDLTFTRYRIGDISTGYWFMMARNLTADIQPLNISDPQATRLSYVWFGAFGNITNGERAWVDDISVNFVIPTPSVNPAESSLGLVVAVVLAAALIGGILYFRVRAHPRKPQGSRKSMKASRFFY